MIINLPWPSAALSPNGRLSWMAKHTKTKRYRQTCGYHALSQGLGILDQKELKVQITFHPPHRYRYDTDNLIARFKAGQDGIVDVCGVDDADWEVTYKRGDVEPGGRVEVWLGIDDPDGVDWIY